MINANSFSYLFTIVLYYRQEADKKRASSEEQTDAQNIQAQYKEVGHFVYFTIVAGQAMFMYYARIYCVISMCSFAGGCMNAYILQLKTAHFTRIHFFSLTVLILTQAGAIMEICALYI